MVYTRHLPADFSILDFWLQGVPYCRVRQCQTAHHIHVRNMSHFRILHGYHRQAIVRYHAPSTSYESFVAFHILVKPSYLPEIIWSIYYKIIHIVYVLPLPSEIKIPLHNNTMSVITQVDSVVRKCIQDPFFHVFEFYCYPLLKHFY